MYFDGICHCNFCWKVGYYVGAIVSHFFASLQSSFMVVEGFIYLSLLSCHSSKGQLISKCHFGVFTFFRKTNRDKSTSSKVELVRSFFGRNIGLKKSFRICLTYNVSIQEWGSKLLENLNNFVREGSCCKKGG